MKMKNIQYDKTTGQPIGEVAWTRSKDDDVIQVEDALWDSLVNPKIDTATKTLVEGPITTDQLDSSKKNLVTQINSLCSTKITSGLQSDALDPGKEMYLYQSQQIDQFNTLANMMDAVSNNKSVMQRCVKISTGEDAFVSHTPDQIKQVVADGKMQILGYLQHCKVLKDQINSANDSPSLSTIDITSGW